MISSFEKKLFNAIKNGQKALLSTYDIWKQIGNTGSEQDFIASLKGEEGTHAIVVNNVTIHAASWVSYNGIYKYTVSDSNILDTDVINVNFSSDSIDAAITSGVLGFTNSISGGFELFSNFLPSSDLVIDYAIITY